MRAGCFPDDVTGPVVICAQAGEANTGAFDSFISGWATTAEDIGRSVDAIVAAA